MSSWQGPPRVLLDAWTLPMAAESVTAARRRLAPLLDGLLTTDERDVALLLLTELLTNAVEHGRAPVLLSARASAGGLRVEVDDSGEEMPRVRRSGEQPVGGWGLRVVDELASRWGTERRPTGGKQVWFELDRDEQAAIE